MCTSNGTSAIADPHQIYGVCFKSPLPLPWRAGARDLSLRLSPHLLACLSLSFERICQSDFVCYLPDSESGFLTLQNAQTASVIHVMTAAP
jgi:hypothetical protein